MNASLGAFLHRDTTILWNPTFSADRGKLHLEARYQWEDWRTGSVWAGRNFEFGEKVEVHIAPMAGLLFGRLNGVAPGYLIHAQWRRLSLLSSSEYVIDLTTGAGNFAFTWNELTVDLDHLLFGIALQRLRTYQNGLDLQKGMMLLRQQGRFLLGMYLFNLGFSEPTVVLNLAYSFEAGRVKR
jgi:hypothetical protein